MFNKKAIAAIIIIALFGVSFCFGQGLADNWNDFLHYTMIGRFDLAKGYAQAIISSEANPVELLELSESNPAGYQMLVRVIDTCADEELVGLSKKVLEMIDEGRFEKRTDAKIIIDEIQRLSSTERGKLTAAKRLHDSGEYAVPYMLDALADPARKDELANIVWALPQVGKDAIRPLTAALQTENTAVKAEMIRALGEIRYPQALAYLKYVIDSGQSSELGKLATEAIEKIDPAALKMPAAELFYRLAENYYYQSESLAPAEDVNFANIWFWDKEKQRLYREKVDRAYFNELMAMRTCEWALKADENFGNAIGLWLAAFFKAESYNIKMPDYFEQGHAGAFVYATTAGPEYIHQALARALNDKNAYVALGAVEALAVVAGEKSLLYQLGTVQPLAQALSFDDKAVKYSAAIAIAQAGPKMQFPQSILVVENLASAIRENPKPENSSAWNEQLANNYALRAAEAMLKLAATRNQVIDLSKAQPALMEAAKDDREQIKILACRILAYLASPDAQRAVAAAALLPENSLNVRVSAFNCLADSAKLNANLLVNETLDAIYKLISSKDTDPQLRSAAAIAYGSLNLPSRKVKDLILDQARR